MNELDQEFEEAYGEFLDRQQKNAAEIALERDAARQKAVALLEENDELRDKVNQLRVEVAELQKQSDETEREHRAAMEKIRSLQDENRRLADALRNSESGREA
jgi:uncharacterized coiled-coil DUF342 family protein